MLTKNDTQQFVTKISQRIIAFCEEQKKALRRKIQTVAMVDLLQQITMIKMHKSLRRIITVMAFIELV